VLRSISFPVCRLSAVRWRDGKLGWYVVERDLRRLRVSVVSQLVLLLAIVFLLVAVGVSTVFAVEQQAAAKPAETGQKGETEKHFVIGFERFSRHGDLDANESGSLLIGELGCTACHATSDPSVQSFVAVQSSVAPDLSDAGNRLNRDWITDYLSDPHAKVPGTRMPDPMWMLDVATRTQKVQAIGAFLRSQKQPLSLPRANGASPVLHEFWNKGDSSRGRDLYHAIGCVACHAVETGYEGSQTSASSVDQLLEQLDPDEIEELGLSRQLRPVPSIPLFTPGSDHQLSEKYSKQSLTLFLLDPHRVRPSGRMPSLRLTPSEAADIAAYLTQGVDDAIDQLPSTASPLDELIDEGKVAFQEFGCATCHHSSLGKAGQSAEPLSSLDVTVDSSCIANPKRTMPKYQLDGPQRQAIVMAIQTLQKSSRESVGDQNVLAADRVKMQMIGLNCVACHERDFAVGRDAKNVITLGGVGRNRKPFFETVAKVDIGDEGRLPPALSGVGAKLTESALQSVFSDKAVAHRPYMTIRMPSYHSDRVKSVIADLPIADSRLDATEGEVFTQAKQIPMDELLGVGRELINTGCVECHVFREEQLPGAVGVNLDAIHKRLQPSWFRQFVENPGQLKHRTRMPTFFPEGKSNRQDLLQGNVDQQIAAIWHYLKSADPLPEKILDAMSQDFEIVPTDRPEVVRTFMQDVGTHAIAVGFPQGVHYAFDSDGCRLVSVWRDRFLDARGTWFERFVPLTKPLGTNLLRLPPSLTFYTKRDDQSWSQSGELWFNGYRLNSEGVPTLRYEVSGWMIEDQVMPYKADRDNHDSGWSLARRYRVTPPNRSNTNARKAKGVEKDQVANHSSDQLPDGSVAEDAAKAGQSDTRLSNHLALALHHGTNLTVEQSDLCRSETGLTVSLLRSSTDSVGGPTIRDDPAIPGEKNWFFEFTGDSEQVLEVRYQWK